MRLSSLHLYPLKSGQVVDVTRWPVDDFGLLHDRRFMVVGSDGQFITQRSHPHMTHLSSRLTDDGLRLELPGEPARMVRRPVGGPTAQVEIWGETVAAWDAGDAIADWLTAWLDQPCRLVYMPDGTRRPIDPAYTDEAATRTPATSRPGMGIPGARVSFADGFPFLLIGEASLADLNARLEAPVEMGRFRPNLVVSGAPPFAEDTWSRIRIGDIEFDVVKPCARCVMTTVDLATGRKGKEPLRTLSTYRKAGGEVLFGQNLVHRGTGELSVGDTVQVLSRRS